MDMIGLNGTLKVLCPEFPDPIPDLQGRVVGSNLNLGEGGWVNKGIIYLVDRLDNEMMGYTERVSRVSKSEKFQYFLGHP
jgi:hypothetical protein